LVAGEAGIGKSRLVAELEARARGLDALALLGECVELAEGELAFSPIISALRGVVEDGETLEGLSDPLRGRWRRCGRCPAAPRSWLVAASSCLRRCIESLPASPRADRCCW